jgi:hypothetical protein
VKTITLRITNAGAAWNATELLGWTQTNLPHGNFSFSERQEVYWEAEMLGFDAKSGELRLRVIDYEADQEGFNPRLKPKQALHKFSFLPLDEEAFKGQLSYYKAGALAEMLASNPAHEKINPAPAAAAEKATAPKEERQVSFTIAILDLTFLNGGVKGEAELPGLMEPITFRIPNDHIVAEFDSIKPFFVKALKRQTAKVSATLVFFNGEPRLTKAASPQIARVDDSMLEIFRARSVRQLLSPDRIKTVDKSLFTPEDVFESLDDDSLGKATLPHDGMDLLAEILRHKSVRNARQLEFLSGRLHEAGRKLRYVLSPNFGFVFFATGQDAHHFILELLDSHATYIWSIPKGWGTMPEQYQAVEREIAAIGQMGRSQYRRTLHFEHEFWFVVHENAERGLVDGFPRWKNRLLEGLV